jgi:YD repeat-containing protein
VLLTVSRAPAQDATILYVYDERSRLVGVVDQQGNAAAYSYDPVGNLLAIERFDTSGQQGPVRIALISPSKGKIGTRVTIIGTGFSATAALHTVSFTGAGATVIEASPNRLVTTVPSGATTGPITVTTPLGSATSAIAFRVLDLSVTPSNASLPPNGARQFHAAEAGGALVAVHWSVNGIPGGNPTLGTISADGLYFAPATAPNPPTVTVTATHRDDVSVTASVPVIVWPPLFFASQGVSVRIAVPLMVNDNLTAAASVAVAPPTTSFIASTGVSARVADSTATFIVGPPVVLRVAEGVQALFTATAASVAVEPTVTAVTPAAVVAGTALTLTLTGAGFTGATGVQFLANNAIDPSITIGDVTVISDSTATLTATIAAGAAVGSRVVRITTPTGSSTAAGTGGNLFTVQ